jgi:predicted dehydrogenase
MPEILRCAVIGAGGIGLEHIRSLLKCPQASLVAIAESDPKRCKEAGDIYKIPRSYIDYREVLDQPDVDAVTIALPNYLHAPLCKLANMSCWKSRWRRTRRKPSRSLMRPGR